MNRAVEIERPIEEKRERKRVYLILRIAFTICLLGFLVYYVDYKELLEIISKGNYTFVAVALLLVIPNLLSQFVKWKILCNKMLDVTDNKLILKSLFIGISAGIFTPLKLGEYVARGIPFKNIGIGKVSMASAVDKLVPLFAIVLFGSVASLLFVVSYFNFIPAGLMIYVAILFGVFVLGGTTLFCTRKRVLSYTSKFKGNKYFSKIIESLEALKRLDKRTIVSLVGLSLLFHLIFTTQMAFLIMAFAKEASFLSAIIIANLIIFTQMIIPAVAFGELGVREGAAVFFTDIYGFSSAAGLNAAIVLFFINLIFPAIVGLFFLVRTK